MLPYLRVWDSHGKARPAFSGACRTRRSGSTRRRSACRQTKSLLSPIHAYYHNIEQINGGRNDMFAAMSTVGGYTMGYFDGSQHEALAVGEGVHAGRQFLHGRVRRLLSQPPVSDLRLHARLQGRAARRCARGSMPDGKLEKKPDSPSARDGAVQTYSGGLGGQITPDGFSVNTTQPLVSAERHRPGRRAAHWSWPTPRAASASGCRCRRKRTRPSATRYRPRASAGPGMRAAGTRRSRTARGRPTRSASVIYTRENNALNFQPHHQPFNYFARFAPGHRRSRPRI